MISRKFRSNIREPSWTSTFKIIADSAPAKMLGKRSRDVGDGGGNSEGSSEKSEEAILSSSKRGKVEEESGSRSEEKHSSVTGK